MNSLIHIADRVLNRPLLITRDKAQVILSVLGARMGVNAPDASRFEGRNERDNTGQTKPYRVTEQGVGIITITGSLVARGAWVGANSGLTSYEGIQHQLKTAKTDDAVRTAIIDLHTPGGEAVLAFETAALVRELAAVKRTIAVVNGMAASAGYAIASGASEIVTAETGVSGSIGVVLLHADFSRQLDREGISPTLIHAGAHKVDGNPFEPLSAEVRDDLQAEVNAFYDAFLSTVAKGRAAAFRFLPPERLKPEHLSARRPLMLVSLIASAALKAFSPNFPAPVGANPSRQGELPWKTQCKLRLTNATASRLS